MGLPTYYRSTYYRLSRFGEISSLWQNFETLWQLLRGYFAKLWTYFGKSFMLLGKLLLFKMANYKKIFLPSGHTAIPTYTNKLIKINAFRYSWIFDFVTLYTMSLINPTRHSLGDNTSKDVSPNEILSIRYSWEPYNLVRVDCFEYLPLPRCTKPVLMMMKSAKSLP